MELLSAVHLGWHSSVTGTALGPQSGQCPLWDGGTEDVEVPHTLQLRLWVLNQTTIPARGQGGEIVVLFFPPSLRLRLQVQVKVNLKLHPWQNPIINSTLSEMPLEVGFALFGMQTDSSVCEVFRKTYLLNIV